MTPDVDWFSTNDDIKLLLVDLGKQFKKDSVDLAKSAYFEFSNYRKSHPVSMNDFVIGFEQEFYQANKHKVKISDDVLGFKIVDNALLDDNHNQMVLTDRTDRLLSPSKALWTAFLLYANLTIDNHLRWLQLFRKTPGKKLKTRTQQIQNWEKCKTELPNTCNQLIYNQVNVQSKKDSSTSCKLEKITFSFSILLIHKVSDLIIGFLYESLEFCPIFSFLVSIDFRQTFSDISSLRVVRTFLSVVITCRTLHIW